MDRSINTPFVMQQWSTQPSGVLQFSPGPFELLKNGVYIVKVPQLCLATWLPRNLPLPLPVRPSFPSHCCTVGEVAACPHAISGDHLCFRAWTPCPSTSRQMWNNPAIRPSGPMCAGVTSNTGDITCFKRIDFEAADQLTFS